MLFSREIIGVVYTVVPKQHKSITSVMQREILVKSQSNGLYLSVTIVIILSIIK